MQQVTDGLIENRANIDPAFIFIYDEEVNDILGQLNSQGLDIEVPEYEIDESKETEMKQAALAMKMFRHKIKEFMPESEHKQQVIEAYEQLHTILFGN